MSSERLSTMKTTGPDRVHAPADGDGDWRQTWLKFRAQMEEQVGTDAFSDFGTTPIQGRTMPRPGY